MFVMMLVILNQISYRFMKQRIIGQHSWGLNVCCGKTDGGGVNADIIRHKDLPHFVKINDVYNLPFKNGQFETVLSSHTIEHLDDPSEFFAELQRIGKKVTIIIPPLWDFSAAFNVLEHKFVFLTFKKEHRTLPKFVRLPFAKTIQKLLGQRMHA